MRPGLHVLSMIHPASRLEVVLHSRSEGRNALKSASYAARSSYRDLRHGKRYHPGKRHGLLSHELIGWHGNEDALWTAAEAAETRKNARVVRELRPSLPAELPLDRQKALVRGFCLWLRDTYGVAIQADIHAPRFLDDDVERKHEKGELGLTGEEYRDALNDPDQTNRNYHAHLLLTTRKICPETRAFGSKTRILDDRKDGPEEILRMRTEWERRTNAELEKAGSKARIDMRSYEQMARDEDAPEGLQAQDHIGPRRSARSRRLIKTQDRDDTLAGKRREATRRQNEDLWSSWLQRRAIDRQQSRPDAVRIAARREAQRKAEADAVKRRLQEMEKSSDIEAVVVASNHLDSLLSGSELAQAIASAQAPETRGFDPDEFDEELDLEEMPIRNEPRRAPPQPKQRERVRVRQRVRVR